MIKICLLLLLSTSIGCSLILVEGSSILEDCSRDPIASLDQVSVSDCDFNKDLHCQLKRGTNASITIDLTPKSSVAQAKVRVGAKIGAMFIPFPLQPEDACNNWGLTCPMEAGKQQTFSLKLPIQDAYPSPPRMKVVFKLVDGQEKDIVCITFPAKIVS